MPLPAAGRSGRRPGGGPRRVSRTRRLFLNAINAQLVGTRALAVVVLLVLLGAAAYWVIGTTGSPLIGGYFIALAVLLGVAVYWFGQVMGMFTGRR